MVLAEFAMFPTDKGESKSEYVAKVIDCIDKSGITYQLTPMGTILEGELEEVLEVIKACHKILEPISNRIYTGIKMDYRNTVESRMKTKIEKVKSIIDREISHS